jgi:sugar phosphate isomerase/epimerase
MSVGQWASEAAGLGLDAIDLSILFVRGQDLRELRVLRQEIEAAGVRVAMVTTYPDFTSPSAEIRQGEASALQEDIAAAAALGAELVRVTAGQAHPETGRDQGINWAIEGLAGAVASADRHGVQALFENHSKPGIWEYPDFSHPTDVFLSIVQGTEGIGLGINFDTANPLAYGDDPLPILEEVIHRVVSVHASDTRERGSLSPVVIGTGLVPFGDIFSRLQGAGFDEWICIEEASGTGRRGVERAVSFIRQAWAGAATEER